MSEKLCIDCVNYQDRSDKKVERHYCLRKAVANKSLVTGKVTYCGLLYCEIERSDIHKCGPNGAYFVERPKGAPLR